MKRVSFSVPEDLFRSVDRLAEEHFGGDIAMAFLRLTEIGLHFFRAELRTRKEIRKRIRALTREVFTYDFADYYLWWEFTPSYGEFVALLLRNHGGSYRVLSVVIGNREKRWWRILWLHPETDRKVLLEMLEYHFREILGVEV